MTLKKTRNVIKCYKAVLKVQPIFKNKRTKCLINSRLTIELLLEKVHVVASFAKYHIRLYFYILGKLKISIDLREPPEIT